MITVKVYEGEAMKEGADLALRHRLFVAGWSLSYELSHARERPGSRKLALAFKHGEPVALAFLSPRNHMMAFCKKAERMNGYASACVKAIKPADERTVANEGLKGTWRFWNKNHVLVNWET